MDLMDLAKMREHLSRAFGEHAQGPGRAQETHQGDRMTPFEEYKALQVQSERAIAAKNAENARLREALQGLVDRLDEIHAHPAYNGMISSYHVHGGVYDGPSWEEPLERARAVLGHAPHD
jgi:hypothetical protein